MAANEIKAIDKASVARICSGQVILDLSTAVKELVENALDAGATTVEVRLKEHGLQLIEVADNGRGVQPKDYEALALKYHTSKLSDFSGLESLHTFGFRGEALSSVAALSELSVTTRTADQTAAVRLDFDRHGKLVNKATCARGVGTTIAVKDLFSTLPVRRQDLQKNVRREVSKLKLLLQQYAILSGQAQLFASDQAGKAARSTLVSTGNAGSGLRDRVSAVLGAKVAALLQPLEFALPADSVKVTGLVSRASCGVKGDKLRQFCCVNGRPVELPRAIKTVNETYKSLYSSLVGLKPLAFLYFELPAGTFDVNVTPDKRSVFVQREAAIMTALGQALQALWEPSRYTYNVNSGTQTFDTQRTPPAAAAAAAIGGGSEPQDEGMPVEDGPQNAAAAATAAAAGGENGAAAAGPPSLVSFLAPGSGPAAAAAATAGDQSRSQQQQQDQDQEDGEQMEDEQPQQQQQQLAPAGASTVGSKRMRPTEQLLSKLAKARHGSSSSRAAAADDDDGDDSDQQEGEHNDDDENDDDDGLQHRSWQQQQQQRWRWQQPVVRPGGLNLASFAMGGKAPDLLSSQQQQQQDPGDLAESFDQQQQQRCAVAAGADKGQKSLIACGFQVRVVEAGSVQQQQQQQQQQRVLEADLLDHDRQGSHSMGQIEEHLEGDRVVDAADHQPSLNQQQQQQQQPRVHGDQHLGQLQALHAEGGDSLISRGTAAAAGGRDSDVEILDADGADPDYAILRSDDPDEQQQQQQLASGTADAAPAAAAAAAPPAIVQYSMQQLMADVQLKLKSIQQQQQGSTHAAAAAAAGSKLAAASLAAAADDGSCPDQSDASAATAAANAAATDELQRVFDKSDFAVMQALGQFNLGFIVARLGQDLFIVDQHAADEKSTFERLMGSYTVNKQPLLHPRQLTTLTHMDQQVIRDYADVFKRNGFEFVEAAHYHQHQQQLGVSEQQQQQQGNLQKQQQQQIGSEPQQHHHQTAAIGPDSPSTTAAAGAGPAAVDPRAAAADQDQDHDSDQGSDQASDLLLTSVPLVRGSGAAGVLGEETLTELLDLIAAGERRPEDLRPKRVRDMLASRACRTSIMIGSHLPKLQQKRVLARLAELDAPWNCPHGRPTMRHLAVLPVRIL